MAHVVRLRRVNWADNHVKAEFSVGTEHGTKATFGYRRAAPEIGGLKLNEALRDMRAEFAADLRAASEKAAEMAL